MLSATCITKLDHHVLAVGCTLETLRAGRRWEYGFPFSFRQCGSSRTLSTTNSLGGCVSSELQFFVALYTGTGLGCRRRPELVLKCLAAQNYLHHKRDAGQTRRVLNCRNHRHHCHHCQHNHHDDHDHNHTGVSLRNCQFCVAHL